MTVLRGVRGKVDDLCFSRSLLTPFDFLGNLVKVLDLEFTGVPCTDALTGSQRKWVLLFDLERLMIIFPRLSYARYPPVCSRRATYGPQGSTVNVAVLPRTSNGCPFCPDVNTTVLAGVLGADLDLDEPGVGVEVVLGLQMTNTVGSSWSAVHLGH